MVILKTNYGDVKIELDFQNAAETANNFLTYVNEGFYDGTLFHRVINGFMVQGGGFDKDFTKKNTHAAIKNEANNGVANKRGTIAMARTSDPHSATAQFFINVADNDFLNFSGQTSDGWGYCVFGKVVEGMDVIDKIKGVKTGQRQGHQNVPIDDVVIEKAVVEKIAEKNEG